MPPPFCVIIPAHNEANVIGRCLNSLLDRAPADAVPEIIVVCNGCVDETASVARKVSPRVRVIELPDGSKPAALNAGNKAATVTPRFYVDADVTVDFPALEAAAALLRDECVQAAAPAIRIDDAGCDRWIKAYNRTWLTQPYLRDNMVGAGLFGLSARGIARVGELPPIIADDEFVRTRFASEERATAALTREGDPAIFTVYPPRRVRDLIRVEARRRAGVAELRARFPGMQGGRSTSCRTLSAAKVALTDKLVYLAIRALGRLGYYHNRMRGRHRRWLRDETSRLG